MYLILLYGVLSFSRLSDWPPHRAVFRVWCSCAVYTRCTHEVRTFSWPSCQARIPDAFSFCKSMFTIQQKASKTVRYPVAGDGASPAQHTINMREI